ncbi:MAG: permease [Thermovenabulum sp.]|uniref:permease n=1 Tax=Thermovenabulum sp. TaxID=3100335 RepID=UPI003C7AC41F
MFTFVLYFISLAFLLISFYKDKKKTKMALMKSWKSFENILPAFAGVLALIGLVLTILTPEIISKIIGANTGFLGMFITSIIGSITLIPGFVAFPLAASLIQRGAGIMQIAVFISTLMMVGFVTLPLEISYFGKRVAFLRNALSYIFSFIVALIIGMVVR